mmetsp:Transcript_22583/g.52025  ORF Transcript_22583/g.52025 Transcript_22583/m.52025 type:complete len:203 (+) Transcript_22583:412-1020(+)
MHVPRALELSREEAKQPLEVGERHRLRNQRDLLRWHALPRSTDQRGLVEAERHGQRAAEVVSTDRSSNRTRCRSHLQVARVEAALVVLRVDEQPFRRRGGPRSAVGREANARAAHCEPRDALRAAAERTRRGRCRGLVRIGVDQQLFLIPCIGELRRVQLQPHAVERAVIAQHELAQEKPLRHVVEAHELGVAASKKAAPVG